MIGARVLFTDLSKSVALAVERAAFRNMGHAAATIRKEAIESILVSPVASRPGTPPHTRRRQLKRAITYDYSKKEQSAVIGPRQSVVGEAGAAHEFGGRFRGEDYPVRAFMEPALDKNLDRFASDWAGSIGS